MSLFEELIEDRQEDEKIVKSFEPKDSLSDQIFEGLDGKFSMRDDIRKRLIEISNDFIESFVRNPEESQIEGLINDSDIYDFYLKYRNQVDEILSKIKGGYGHKKNSTEIFCFFKSATNA